MADKNVNSGGENCDCSIQNNLNKALEDEIKVENRRNFIKSNMKLIISVGVSVIVGITFLQFWKSHKYEQQKNAANDFYQMKYQYYSNNRSGALDLSKIIADNKASDGYAVLSKLVQAGILSESSNAECIEIYKEISLDKKISRFFSDFAYVRYVNILLDTKSIEVLENEIDSMINHLHELISTKSPWDMYIRLSLSYCYLKKEQYDMAVKTLEEMDRMGVAIELRDRVSTLLNYAKQKLALSSDSKTDTNEGSKNN